ncbi:amidohydrolase family protein [Dehalococcoidia bacterium]|nr:amidohydrolase family protein [Dehalococcoidia bacterium]
MHKHKLISADSHIVEPPDLWQTRVPSKYRDRAPKMIRMEQGDAWAMEGSSAPFPFGLNTCAGLGEEGYRPWIHWENVRHGTYLPEPRLALQDQDHTDAEVLYPSPRIGINIFSNNLDVEFHLACIRAYNDWLAEFCSFAPDRLIGLALIPTVGIDNAVEELNRATSLPGIRGAMLGQYPSGGVHLTEDDDPFWQVAQANGIPVNIHVSLADQTIGSAPAAFFGAFTGALRFSDAPYRAQEFIYMKVFDRFPNLKVVFAEVDAAWVPYVREQLDDRYERQNRNTRPAFNLNPSAYFDRNLFWTIVADGLAVKYRHDVGLSQILWSSDFPHGTCDWPDSDKQIARDFAHVPVKEKHRILAGNAALVYNLAE